MEDLDFINRDVGQAGGDASLHSPRPRRLDRLHRAAAHSLRPGRARALAGPGRASGQPVGTIGLLRQEVDGQALAEVGYRLDSTYWGRGFATEAARAVRDWAFTVRDEPVVISLIVPENHSSQAVARRLGMTLWRRWPRSGIDNSGLSAGALSAESRPVPNGP
ncbi:MAG: GNAT family N-acetyltransferase [Gemmatimonadales bacterium]